MDETLLLVLSEFPSHKPLTFHESVCFKVFVNGRQPPLKSLKSFICSILVNVMKVTLSRTYWEDRKADTTIGSLQLGRASKSPRSHSLQLEFQKWS